MFNFGNHSVARTCETLVKDLRLFMSANVSTTIQQLMIWSSGLLALPSYFRFY